MKRPPESLKSFANHVGSITTSNDGSQAVRLLHLAGFLDNSTKRHIDSSDNYFPEPVPDQVGIWGRRVENGESCWVRRPETKPEWLFWANAGRIEAKGKKKRVVLIGESVTRGYLYDPQYNPATALQAMLDTQGEFEVIDLARTNLTYKVRALAHEALQLEPDIAIIFSGNNWAASGPTAVEFAQIDAALASDGVAGAKRTTEAQVLRKARGVVNDISEAYESKGIPLVWIIPEFNLTDWRDPLMSAPYLPAGLNQKWHILREEAQHALRAGNFERAENLAQQMVEIDQGVCPVGFYILADCRRASGDLEGTRKYLELAKDASIWDFSRPDVPKPFSITQGVLREEVPKYKQNQLIDLPVLFKDYLQGDMPGRRLFLDYCHMTSEGIQIAMGEAASCVLRALKGVEASRTSLIGKHSEPALEIEAEALFLGALLTAHFAPAPDVVRHFCTRALSNSAHVAGLMLGYIDLQTRSAVPMLMSETDDELHKLGSPLIHHYLLRLNDKRLDASLLDVIVDALRDVGIDAREQLNQVRREEHSVTVRETNLLDYYYCSSDQPLEAIWVSPIQDQRYQPDARYYKAYTPESRFVFVGEAEFPVQLCLTCRLPESQGSILVEVNGKPLGEIAAGRDWTTWDLTVDAETVRDGINEITVSWPIVEFDYEQALKEAAMKMYELKFPHFYPVFGEIHSFIASNGKKVQTGYETAELVQLEV